jgi:hypothetical protein
MGGRMMAKLNFGNPNDEAIQIVVEYTKKINGIIDELTRLETQYYDEQARYYEWEAQHELSTLSSQRKSALDHKLFLLQNVHLSKRAVLESILPAARRLAQYLSQRIEHGVTEPLDAVKLSLRLAELEGVIRNGNTLIAKGIG